MLKIIPVLIDISVDDDLSAAANVAFESAGPQAREDFLLGQHVMGLEIPALTSTIIYLQASIKEGGTYRRILKADGSEDWNIAAGTGNRMIFIDEAAAFSFLKVECATGQAADRTFNFLVR